MPELSAAATRIHCRKYGIAVLFKVCEVEYVPVEDEYRHVLQELSKEGLNRNVFLVDSKGAPVWRVHEYEQQSRDCFVLIRAADDSYDYILGETFQGFTFKINLLDGTLTDRRWAKS